MIPIKPPIIEIAKEIVETLLSNVIV